MCVVQHKYDVRLPVRSLARRELAFGKHKASVASVTSANHVMGVHLYRGDTYCTFSAANSIVALHS